MNNPSTCPHFSLCSGCEIGKEFSFPPIWCEALAFFEKYLLHPSLFVEGFSHTRLRAKLAIRPDLQGDPQIGLFRRHSHEVIAIPHCLVHHPSINRAVAILREEIFRHQISAYSEKTGQGLLRYIQLFVERSTHRIQLALVSTEPSLESFCRSLQRRDLWHSIWINHHPHRSNRVLGDTWYLFSGEPFLWQTINQTPIAFHPGAFAQSHLSLFEKIGQKIATWVRPEDKILELYAGVGAIGLTLPVKQITLVENNPFAYLSFQQSKKDIPYLCLDAKEADLFGYDVVLVDPPRKGLDALLVKKLKALTQGRLIYVSCGFQSFRRDAEELLAAGWQLKEANGYLLFPGTNQVEILALFVR